MNCIIKLYKSEIGFISSDLLMFDDIESYLSKYTPDTFEISYQKIELQKEIKIILNQEFQNPLKQNRYTYVSLQNSGENKLYYYVKSIKWVSQNCCKLDLILDTLNTFKLGVDYSLSNRTRVLREHKDRFTVIPEHDIENPGRKEYVNFVKYIDDELVPDTTAINNFESVRTDSTFLTLNIGIQMPDKRNIVFNESEFSYFQPMIHVIDKNNIAIFNSADYRELISYNWKDGQNIEIKVLSYEILPDGSYEEKTFLFNYLENTIYFMYDNNIGEDMFYSYDDYLGFLDQCGGYVTFGTPTYVKAQFYRNIDKISEGINPTLYHGEKTIIRDSKDINFYLGYYSDTDEAVKCLLYPERTMAINSRNFSSTGLQLTPSMLIENLYYNISELYNSHLHDNKLFIDSNLKYLDDFHQYHQLVRKGNKILVSSYAYQDTTSEIYYTQFLEVDFLTINSNALNNNSLVYGTTTTPLFKNGFRPTMEQGIFTAATCSGKQFTFNKSSSLSSVLGFKSIDKSLSNIVKILKLPYCPDDFDTDEDGNLVISNEWDINGGVIELTDLNKKFQRSINTDLISPCYKFYHIEESDLKKGKKDINLESKLFSSEFFSPKFIYDSFTYSYNLELVDYLKYSNSFEDNKVKIVFIPSSTINSRFAFRFKDNIVTENNLLDFNEWMIVTRNNEETLYNNAYLNYIKTGYNYDVKAKERQQVATGIGLGVSIASTVGSLISAIATQGATLPLVVASIGGTVTSVMSTINSTMASEDQINRKLDELSKQSTNVRGADDIDLFSRYGKNRLLYCEYSPSKELKNKIFELFYLTGYACDEIKIPNTHSRELFNYLKCEPIFNINNILIDDNILSELTSIYNYGFTIIHGDDISFENENYESSLKNYYK